VDVILVSRGQKDESCSTAKRAPPKEAHEKNQEEVEVTSTDKDGAPANDAIVFPTNFGDPSDLYATSKAYTSKFFNKFTEVEKWELEWDLLNSMLQNAWGKADAESSDIQQHKKDTCEFFDHLLCKRKVNHSPISPQVSRKKSILVFTLIL
jgi:hypothetical protein